MTPRAPTRTCAALLALLALQAVPLAAQPAQGAPAQPPGPDSVPDVEMVSEREVFRYPAFERRNPFRPLLGDEAGPRFEQIELRGIIFDANDPNRSVALLGLRQQVQQAMEQQVQQQVQQQQQAGAPQPDTIYVPEPSTRVRVGMRWGNMVVRAIQANQVILDVTEFGMTEQRTLSMTVRRQGGPG